LAAILQALPPNDTTTLLVAIKFVARLVIAHCQPYHCYVKRHTPITKSASCASRPASLANVWVERCGRGGTRRSRRGPTGHNGRRAWWLSRQRAAASWRRSGDDGPASSIQCWVGKKLYPAQHLAIFPKALGIQKRSWSSDEIPERPWRDARHR